MRRGYFRPAVAVLLWILCSLPLWAQNAITNHRVILRQGPSTSSPVPERLPVAARLVLVEATPTNSFYHVRTEDDEVGWAFTKFVSISPTSAPGSPTAPNPSTTPPAPMLVSTECDASMAAHVYRPQRLIVKQDCIAVTGTIVDATANQPQKEPDGVRHEADGDTLLNAGNLSEEGGTWSSRSSANFLLGNQMPRRHARAM